MRARRRNKQLAHYDYDALFEPKVNPIPEPTRIEIETALAALQAFMNAIDIHFRRNATSFKVPVVSGGVDSLIELLAKGLRYDEMREKRKIPWDDFSKSEHYQV